MTNAERIAVSVALHYGLTLDRLLSRVASQTTRRVLHRACWMVHRVEGLSYQAIGSALGRDATTVMYAIRRVDCLRERDPEVRADLDRLELDIRRALTLRDCGVREARWLALRALMLDPNVTDGEARRGALHIIGGQHA
jgi:hypothetical protein